MSNFSLKRQDFLPKSQIFIFSSTKNYSVTFLVVQSINYLEISDRSGQIWIDRLFSYIIHLIQFLVIYMKILYYAYVIFCFGNDGVFTPHVFWTILKLLLRLFIVLTTEKNSGKPDREVGKKNNLFEIYLSNSQFVCLLVCFFQWLEQ